MKKHEFCIQEEGHLSCTFQVFDSFQEQKILFGFIEDIRLLDDKKVPQVSQFEEMTSRRGVKYGYDNSIQLYAGSLCFGSYFECFRSFFRNSRAFSALTLDSRRLCINRTLLAFKAMHKRLGLRGGRSLARWVFKNYYTSKTTR